MSPSVTMFVRNDLSHDSRVWREAFALRDAGWHVRLVGVQTAGAAAEEVRDGVEVTRLALMPLDSLLYKRLAKPQDPAFAAPPPPGSARVQPKRLSLGRLTGALRRAWGPVHDELATREFTRLALAAVAGRPTTVYHAHDLSALRPALAARRYHGGKVVFDAHEFYSERNFYRPPGRFERTRIRAEERRGCRAADLCVTVSESIADELQRRYGLTPRPTVVMNSPAVPDVLRPADLRGRLGLGPDERLLLYLGAITYNRGIEQTIGALSELSGVHFGLLGPEQRGFRGRVEAAAAAARVAERVHFLGSVASADVVAAASGADAAVVLIQNACLSYYYCSPNKLFEALAAGLPVVASDFPDLRRVLAGRGVGELCDPADVPAIAKAVRAVLAYPRERVARQARELARGYAWDVQTGKFLAVYEQLEIAASTGRTNGN